MSAQRRRRVLLRVLLAIAGLGAVAFAVGTVYFLAQPDPPPPPRLERPPVRNPGRDGVYHVALRAGSFAGYRMHERYAAFARDAAGRTTAIRGSARVRGREITSASFHADLSRLRSDKPGRDRALRSRAIETDTYRDARFALTAPASLVPPGRGSARSVARGTLMLHGVSRPVRIRAEAQWRDRSLEIVGSVRLQLRQFDIEPPSVAGLVTVASEGDLEFRLVLGGVR